MLDDRAIMKLAKYLTDHDLSHKDFADMIGVTSEAVRLYATGQRRPRQNIIEKIREHTDGKVMAGDFFGDPERESANGTHG